MDQLHGQGSHQLLRLVAQDPVHGRGHPNDRPDSVHQEHRVGRVQRQRAVSDVANSGRVITSASTSRALPTRPLARPECHLAAKRVRLNVFTDENQHTATANRCSQRVGVFRFVAASTNQITPGSASDWGCTATSPRTKELVRHGEIGATLAHMNLPRSTLTVGVCTVSPLLGALIMAAPASAVSVEQQPQSVHVATITRAVAAPKPGRVCKRKGRTVTTGRFGTLKCAKKGKRLVWKKVPTPTPITAPLTCATGGTCVVGSTGPAGGIVFYVSGTRRLEAAPADLPGSVAWCNNDLTDITGAVGTSVGTGSANTTAMVAGCTSGAGNSARSYSGGGKNDWFLPSKDELNQLYVHRAVVGGFTTGAYWSSSQFQAAAVWGQLFSNGDQPFAFKYLTGLVRPVRAF